MKSGKNGKKRGWIVAKHFEELDGAGFAESCAPCSGAGKLTEDGRMLCSRVGATPEAVTVAQARACDGTKPPMPVDLEVRGLRQQQDDCYCEVHI